MYVNCISCIFMFFYISTQHESGPLRLVVGGLVSVQQPLWRLGTLPGPKSHNALQPNETEIYSVVAEVDQGLCCADEVLLKIVPEPRSGCRETSVTHHYQRLCR